MCQSCCGLDGIVEELGADCKSEIRKGDKVYGVCHCADLNSPEDGSFAEYAVAKDEYFAKIPDNMTLEGAATLRTGITFRQSNSVHGFESNFAYRTSKSSVSYTYIYGDNMVKGTLAFQFAKLSGLLSLPHAVQKNFELVKLCGVGFTFYYHDPLVLRTSRNARGTLVTTSLIMYPLA
ncbi:hypothetical protein B0O99DRAFT_691303 [Bisporella sp. PMI_857]|nr:hypothetical protein B0O99DRAFT_691303 [Bisporella sp. PMI_857]